MTKPRAKLQAQRGQRPQGRPKRPRLEEPIVKAKDSEPEKQPQTPLPPYMPTRLEGDAAHRIIERRKKRQPMPLTRISGKDGEKPLFAFDHPDKVVGTVLMSDGLGISDTAFLKGYLDGVIKVATAQNATDVGAINSMLGAIYGMKPSDEVEAMLLAQMVATHELSMTLARQLAKADSVPLQDSAVNALTKLTRTFSAQLAALKQYRTGGEQRVIVQRVDVREGGQAVVGMVAAGGGGGGNTKNEGLPHAKQVNDARGAAVLCEVEAQRIPVPIASGDGSARVPDARRDEPRSSDREGERQLQNRGLVR